MVGSTEIGALDALVPDLHATIADWQKGFSP